MKAYTEKPRTNNNGLEFLIMKAKILAKKMDTMETKDELSKYSATKKALS